MQRFRGLRRGLLVLVCLAVAPVAARAQSAIAGVVKDATGAVMPGVTVEASSPVLIEKVRSVVSDGQGQYKIIDLRPGVYTVTFTLTGFNTVKRDGIELPSNFTSVVNAELKVGAIEETVMVSGQSPVVDVQNAVQQTVLTRQVLDAVPTGRSVPTLGALLPGARLALPDVGGTSGMQNRDLTVHGSDGRDTTFQVDGMTLNGIEGDGSVQSYFNEAMFEEITYQTSAISAETSAGGVRANMIPKDGGNSFKGTMFLSGGNQNLQSNNSDDAKAKGLAAPDSLNKVWDFNMSEGGPILRDRLWFFSSYRDWGVYQYIANSFFKSGDQTVDDASIRSGLLRLTSQVNAKNKVAVYLDRIRKFRGHENAAPAGYAIAGEATDIRAPKQYYTTEAKWTSTVSSKLLLEAGLAINNESYTLEPQAGSANVIPRRDTILQTAFGAYDGGLYYREPIRRTAVASASYVTGSHALKAGIQYGWGYFWRTRRETADLIQLYRTNVPAQVIIHNTPQSSYASMNADQGIYVQDSWTIGRFTINPGVRFEHFNGSTEATEVLAGRFVPARQFAAIPNLPNWNDVAPRFGFAWDVQGDGKTAVKVGTGKYVRAYSTGFADTYDPNFYTSATLTWTDLNGDDIAQGTRGCVYRTPGCEIDFSTLPVNFGTKPLQNPAPGVARPYQIETNVSVQREIVPGTSVTFSYFRRDYRNLIWSDNLGIDPSDYTPVSVPSPIGGETVTIYNLNPAKASAFNLLDSNSSSNYRKYIGYDVNFNSRMKGLTLFGGVSLGHQVSNTCEVEDPNLSRYCDQSQYSIPYYTQVKLNGSYMLPWQLSVSGTFQSYPGDARNASMDTTIAAEDPSLRVNWSVDRTLFRTLTGQTLTQSSVTVPLIAPGTKLLDRQNQLDIRLKRQFRVRRFTLEAQADAYNAFNTGVVLNAVQTYGSNLDRPASILQGRLLRFGMQAKF
ncbi:MAG: TonB-dependent receptor [Acidobacteria bacterium]|nr:TonB-dependent receptor [Acidobacteriota bacterium]